MYALIRKLNGEGITIHMIYPRRAAATRYASHILTWPKSPSSSAHGGVPKERYRR
jgi:hypothetical protein